MEMARFVKALESDLAAVAAVRDEETKAKQRSGSCRRFRFSGACLLDALGEAAMSSTLSCSPGRIAEVRLVVK